jgi:LAO/AO transport system kinase
MQPGDRRELAAALTLIEQGRWTEADWERLPPAKSNVLAAGITGAGGAGKSTLIAALVPWLRERGLTVAVLATDPSSPVTGGALLGDRIRIDARPDDPGFYFRSFGTRGETGGISAAVAPAVRLLKSVGFDVVLVETIGAGQDQVAVRACVDRLVLVLTPQAGDQIQLQKAGLLEVADVIAINKADLTGADILLAMMRECLPDIPVIPVVAAQGQGLERLWNAVTGQP